MKVINTKKIVAIALALSFLTTPFNSFAQNPGRNYVIAGAFTQENNAKEMIRSIRDKGNEASYLQYHYSNGQIMHYVYLFASNNQDEVRQRASILKSDEEFEDVWVLAPKGKKISVTAHTMAVTEPEKSATIADVAPEVIKEEQIALPESNEANEQGEYKAVFRLWDDVKGKPVSSKILVSHENSSLRNRRFNNDQVLAFSDAKIKASSIAFGYKDASTNIDLYKLAADSARISLKGDTVVIDWVLQQIRKGDIQVMYNVIFHPDAAVMKSESKLEMNTLLTLLQENDGMKVKIHGHTNGTHFGKIIRVLKEGSLFSLTPDNKKRVGSAKDLSELRAETIQKYLVKNGVSEDRMEIKGWGGDKMIYDKDDVQAKKNARVEIEILED